MSFTQPTLRSFLTTEGKLVLCNELFFLHFGHCTQHLIGKSVFDVFSDIEGSEVVKAVKECQLHPEQSFTAEMEKPCREGCSALRWSVYAERQQGRITGIHLVGSILATATA